MRIILINFPKLVLLKKSKNKKWKDGKMTKKKKSGEKTSFMLLNMA